MRRRRDRRGRKEEEPRLATEMAQYETEARTQQDADQTAADADQTQADSDQTGSDADQLTSDSDQALADRDQDASNQDQAAADSELSHAHGAGFVEAFEASRVKRDTTTRERESTAAARSKITAKRAATASLRDEVARVRDLSAAARDRTAQARDEAADARDRAAEARERHAVEAGNLDDAVSTLRALRESGASVRQQSALERISAEADRRAAAADRERAAADRREAGLDELTGIFRRGTGELALTHEIGRSQRSGRSLVFAVIDIDSLKAVNDSQGHAAGDAFLRDVATAITSTLRSYDVTVRWGGDEFVCALSDMTLEAASERVAAIRRALEALRPGTSISAGLAELGADDTLESLVARADADLYRSKTNRDI